MENKNMEMTNQVVGGVSKSNGGKVAGLLLGALGVVGGLAAAAIYKKKKAANSVEEVEAEVVENDDSKSEE